MCFSSYQFEKLLHADIEGINSTVELKVEDGLYLTFVVFSRVAEDVEFIAAEETDQALRIFRWVMSSVHCRPF